MTLAKTVLETDKKLKQAAALELAINIFKGNDSAQSYLSSIANSDFLVSADVTQKILLLK